MIINGRKIRDEILGNLRGEIKGFDQKLKLAIFMVGNDPVIENFVRYKKKTAQDLGIDFLEYKFDLEMENLEEVLITKIKEVGNEVQGIVVQLPLPDNLDEDKILRAVPINLDIDVLNKNNDILNILSPVTGAVWEILRQNGVETNNKKILIVGSGKLVGQPTYKFFQNKSAEIAMINFETKNKQEFYKQADIIISGVGVPNLIKPEIIKEGVILIDAGTSTQAKKVVGDIDLACESKASIFAKTPGGVGPITIAILYRNLVELYKKNN